ncbi:MAG: type II toxin-antitoxin system VapC family toxin [Acidobacteriia bacterium]|nr:type II toxin-antitoxin system VapC family toxin [Terriglobia bacterium]
MIILDTNVLSEALRPVPSPDVVRWLSAQSGELAITTLTQAEILYGIERMPAGKRRAAVKSEIEAVLSQFLGRILPFDERAAEQYAVIAALRESMGRPISQTDAMIAAIARCHGASIATRDTAGFNHCGVGLINPWKR